MLLVGSNVVVLSYAKRLIIQLKHPRIILTSKDPIWTWHDTKQLARLPVSTAAALMIPESSWEPLAQKVVRSGMVGMVTRDTEKRYLQNFFGLQQEFEFDLEDVVEKIIIQQRLLQLVTIKALFKRWQPETELVGEHHLHLQKQSGRGAIIWQVPFVFATLASKLTLHERGYPLYHLSRFQHPYTRSHLGACILNPIRCIPENRLLKERIVIKRGQTPRAAMVRMKEVLRDGSFVSITVGASAKAVESFPFFGSALLLPTAPLKLANQCGVPLLPTITVWDNGRYITTIEKPVSSLAEVAKSIEAWASRFPEQLMWRDSMFDHLAGRKNITSERFTSHY